MWVICSCPNQTSRENRGQEFAGEMVNPTKHALEKIGHQQNLGPPSHKISTALPQEHFNVWGRSTQVHWKGQPDAWVLRAKHTC